MNSASALPEPFPQFYSDSFSAKNLLILELVYLSFSVQIFWFPYMILAIVPGKSMNQSWKTWSYFIDPNHCYLVLGMNPLYLPFLERLCYLFSFLKETQSHGLRSPSVYFLPTAREPKEKCHHVSAQVVLKTFAFSGSICCSQMYLET